MAPNPTKRDLALERLYAQLPPIACQGFCADSCGPISLSVRERERMEKMAGHALGVNGMSCNMLIEGKCAVYELRPMICRLWGVVKSLPCHYGCEPEGGFLPDDEGARLLTESIKAGGPVTHADAELVMLLDQARSEMGDELLKRELRRVFTQVVPRPQLSLRDRRRGNLL